MGCWRSFAGKKTSWACLESGLKLIFHWKANFLILGKSLFKSFFALLILCTVTNNEVSSANSFRLNWRPSGKLLKWIRYKRAPRIDPCGTPARTSLQYKCWPFRINLCFRDFKKSVQIFKSGPPIPFCPDLLMRPLCQTLSNAFVLSKNTPRNS